MQHALMADRHVRADHQRQTALRVGTVVGDVQHAVVLHVAARADDNLVDVATGDAERPERGIITDDHCADHERGRIEVDARAELGPTALEHPEVAACAHAAVGF